MKYRRIYFLISGALLIPSLLSLIIWGLKPALDFTGGTLYEIKVETQDFASQDFASLLRAVVSESGHELVSIQSSGENQYLLKLPPINEEQHRSLRDSLSECKDAESCAKCRDAKSCVSTGGIEEIRFETVGPSLGRELLYKTLTAVALAAGFIMLYVAWQCQGRMYGVCAILAMFHDSLILVGSFSLLGHFWRVEVDTLFVTAVLTTLSFSVHDTVVIFKSIREKVSQYSSGSRDAKSCVSTKAINFALTETLMRSLNNSLTIIFMLVALVVLGGETIRWFAVALLIGTILGTFSSTFISAPLLLVWQDVAKKLSKNM